MRAAKKQLVADARTSHNELTTRVSQLETENEQMRAELKVAVS
jgi:hypothetical protein